MLGERADGSERDAPLRVTDAAHFENKITPQNASPRDDMSERAGIGGESVNSPLEGTTVKKLMDAGYENAYRGDGFSHLNIRIDVEDMGGHYALSVKMILTINHNHRERFTSSHSGAFEFVEYTPQANHEYADALAYSVDEVRRLCKLAGYNDHDASAVVRDVVASFNSHAGLFVEQHVNL